MDSSLIDLGMRSWCLRKGKTELFAKVAGVGSTVYDLGARIRFYTVLSSQLVGLKGRVSIQFTGNMSYLQRQISLNLCKM